MNETELRQLFKNSSDCYADTWMDIGTDMLQGEVIQAMTENRFIEVLRQAKLLAEPSDAQPAKHTCTYSKAMNQPYPRLCVDCGRPEPNKQQQ